MMAHNLCYVCIYVISFILGTNANGDNGNAYAQYLSHICQVDWYLASNRRAPDVLVYMHKGVCTQSNERRWSGFHFVFFFRSVHALAFQLLTVSQAQVQWTSLFLLFIIFVCFVIFLIGWFCLLCSLASLFHFISLFLIFYTFYPILVIILFLIF